MAEVTSDELERIERLSKEATDGPWISFVEGRNNESGSNFIMTSRDDIELLGATIADQDFIASARQDVPNLIAEVRRLQNLVGKLKDERDCSQ